MLPEGVQYPVWIEPVNGASSEGAFTISSDAELREKLPEVRAVINRLGHPFQEEIKAAYRRCPQTLTFEIDEVKT